jgi:hypothetical protein
MMMACVTFLTVFCMSYRRHDFMHLGEQILDLKEFVKHGGCYKHVGLRVCFLVAKGGNKDHGRKPLEESYSFEYA